MQDYKPNSNRFKAEQQVQQSQQTKEPEKKLTQVAKGKVTVKKKSEVSKFIDKYVAEDVSNIKNYIISDVIIPTIKNTIWDAFTNSLDMILFGGNKRDKRSSGGSRVSYVSYDKYSNRDDKRSSNNEPRRNKYDFDDIVFDDKRDAEEVLRQLDAALDTYRIVTVSDLYDLIGKTAEYTDQKYGWTNLRNADWVRTRDGYKLSLPKPLPID